MPAGPLQLGAIGYGLGDLHAIETLGSSDLALAPDWAASEGLAQYSAYEGSPSALYATVIGDSLARAGLAPDEVGAVLFAPSRAHWSTAGEQQLFAALAEVGFSRVPVVGVGLQACSALAAQLIQSAAAGAAGRPVLLLQDGLAPSGAVRLDTERRAVFSDGVACALVTTSAGDHDILGAYHLSSPWLAMAPQLAQSGRRFREVLALTSEAAAGALAEAGLSISDVDLVACTNLNSTSFDFIADLVEADPDRVWRADLARIGHVHGCDNLIALAGAVAADRLAIGEVALLFSWSPHVCGAVVTRRLR